MSVIERMARAIWDDREQHQNERCRQSWERGSELARQFAMDHARAALAALLEPSEAMMQAAWVEAGQGGDPPEVVHAAIQAALDEKGG
jgi:hypothetical protein